MRKKERAMVRQLEKERRDEEETKGAWEAGRKRKSRPFIYEHFVKQRHHRGKAPAQKEKSDSKHPR